MFKFREDLKDEIKELRIKLDDKEDELRIVQRDTKRTIDDLAYENSKLLERVDEKPPRSIQECQRIIDKLKIENEKLSVENKELSANEAALNLKIANNEINVLQSEVALKNKLIKELSNLPDVKRMIDNVANMRVPAVEEFKSLFELIKNDSSIKLMENLNNLPKRIEEVLRDGRFGRGPGYM